ncbi:MAG: hypothetical protein JWN51_1391 [Phycisphaerales bacterium]|nr:hypothetical protein [Phycisphaerales bacterium]
MAENPSDWVEKKAEEIAKEPDPLKAVNTTLTPPEVDIEKPPGADKPAKAGPVHEVVPVRPPFVPPSDDRNNPDQAGPRGDADAGRAAQP